MNARVIVSLALLGLVGSGVAFAGGDASRGAKAFRACIACHALEPERNRTGPSLAGLIGRKAGGLESFPRYSPALKGSGIVWSERTLDAWLRDSAEMVPGNYMSFAGIADARARADLIAFLTEVSSAEAPRAPAGSGLPDLRTAPPSARVASIRYCADTYFVTNGAGETRPYWEFNLRFKTDGSRGGPAQGAPVLVSQGMQGDRAQVVFSRPEEISRFIREGC